MAKQKMSQEYIRKAAMLLLIIIPFNVYAVTSLFTHSAEMFYWPRIVNSSLELPSITVLLPLWLGLNMLYVYTLRSIKNKNAKKH
jgi:hypothetical protein